MLQSIGKIFTFISIVVLANNAFAYENEFVLKAGFALSRSLFNNLSDDNIKKDREETTSYGVHTAFAYKKSSTTLGLESRITLGRAQYLHFSYDQQTIEGEGRIRTVDISPFWKIHTKVQKVSPRVQNFFSGIYLSPWYGYFKIGPSWMLQTLDLDGFKVNGLHTENHKLTYESHGLSVALGLEESVPYVTMHPIYLEVSASVYESFKVSLVDKSDSQAINVLKSQETKQPIRTYSIHFIVGMALF